MHDPMVVAHTIPRPFPQRSKFGNRSAADEPRWSMRYSYNGKASPWWKASSYRKFWTVAGHELYWPSLVVIWHVEPGGQDMGTVCKHSKRWQDADGKWHSKAKSAWKWHVHHWRIQVPALQEFRRWLLTRCEWCGGKSRNGDKVNVSHSWSQEPGKWWQGKRGLYHHDCSSVMQAHRTCTCEDPILDGNNYGTCAKCLLFRAFGQSERWTELAKRIKYQIPKGTRDKVVYSYLVEETKDLARD